MKISEACRAERHDECDGMAGTFWCECDHHTPGELEPPAGPPAGEAAEAVWVAIMETEHFRFMTAGASEAAARAEMDEAFYRHLAGIPDAPSREEWIAEHGSPAEAYGAWILPIVPGQAYRDDARI